jgi:hypothetical protein
MIWKNVGTMKTWWRSSAKFWRPRMLITYEEELPGDPLECNWASDEDDEAGKVETH